jgi:predicted flap endonuclease-1-like 5' DNA nuclease
MMVSNNTLVLIVVALIALGLLAFVILRRGQRVDLGVHDDAPIASTLERNRPDPVPSAPPPVAPGDGDNLGLIKGVGPRLVAQLHSLGVTRFEQLASLDDSGVAALDAQLTGFTGRISRDNWVDQARLLASGDTASFEARYGKLDGGTK